MTQATGPPARSRDDLTTLPLTQTPIVRRKRGRNPLVNLISPAWWEETYARLERIAWAIIRLIGLGGLIYIFIHNA